VLALDGATVEILNEWLDFGQSFPGAHLFCVLRGKTVGGRWSDAQVRWELKELAHVLGGKRLNIGSLRTTLTAELIVEQWPLPYIQTRLGLQGIWSFREILPKLGIAGVPEEEVAVRRRSLGSHKGP